jgi:tRNA1(Val) A37 N6-methylase TrmN6
MEVRINFYQRDRENRETPKGSKLIITNPPFIPRVGEKIHYSNLILEVTDVIYNITEMDGMNEIIITARHLY